ncbi:MAG: carboxypeptidase regulatory-like domain-containing protein [Myxococcota bacterium]
MSTITISGKTLDQNGNPVEGVIVILIGNTPGDSNKKINDSTESDSNGNYSFDVDESVDPTNCFVSLQPEPIFDINNPPSSNESVYFSSPSQYSSGVKKPSSLDFKVWSCYLIYGTITDSDSNSIPNANISVNGYWEPGTATANINSLSDYYYFYAQEGQSYTLTPTSAGYSENGSPLNISSLNQNTQANFLMTEDPEMINITDWLQTFFGGAEVTVGVLAATAGFFYFLAKMKGWSCATSSETDTTMSGIEMQDITSFAASQGTSVPPDMTSVAGTTTLRDIQSGAAGEGDQDIVEQGIQSMNQSSSENATTADGVVKASSDLSESSSTLNEAPTDAVNPVANQAFKSRVFQANVNDGVASAQEGQEDAVVSSPSDLSAVQETFGTGEGTLAESAEMAEEGEAAQVASEMLTTLYGEAAAEVGEVVQFALDIGLVIDLA